MEISGTCIEARVVGSDNDDLKAVDQIEIVVSVKEEDEVRSNKLICCEAVVEWQSAVAVPAKKPRCNRCLSRARCCGRAQRSGREQGK